MKYLAMILAGFWLAAFLKLGEKFVDAKIKNDSSIAADTKRIADALEKK